MTGTTMHERLQSELKRILGDFNMGFITPLEAINQSIDALCAAQSEAIDLSEQEKNEDDLRAFLNSEKLSDIYGEFVKKWIEE